MMLTALVANVGTKVNWKWLLVVTALTIFCLVVLLRNYVQDSWGELRLSLICAKERLAMLEAADLDKAIDPDLLKKCIEFDKNTIKELEAMIEKTEKRWKFFFRGRVITSFDSSIMKQEIAYKETLEKIKNKSTQSAQ